ncbi:MAG: hypothetical protein PHH13_03535 [Candidatus Peribacteraceae bacterium]|nr:hypothetical protein [Candidatus Peribacteraceae bacterium]
MPSDPTPPVIPDPKDLYNKLMQPINPELTTEALDHANEKYNSTTEAPEQTATRAEKSEQSFAQFHTGAAQELTRIGHQASAYMRGAQARQEEQSKGADEATIISIESSMNFS